MGIGFILVMIMIQRHARVLTYVDIKPAFELRA